VPGCAEINRSANLPAGKVTTDRMTIAPASDIVLDAMMAADPARSQAVADRLSQLRSSRAGDFDPAVGAPGGVDRASSTLATGATSQDALTPAMLAQRPPPRIDPAAAGGGAVPPAYRKFEAFVLQTFIEAMLPRGSAVNFGKGVAGDVWRSMLAEQLGSAVAKSGGVGIARFLAAAHPGEARFDPKAALPKVPAVNQAQAAALAGSMRPTAANTLDDSGANS